MKRLLLVLLLVIAAPAFAQQGKVIQCGVPDDILLETDPKQDYCDIHTRAAAYREKDRAYREQLELRRANYAAPRAQALEAFKAQQSGNAPAPQTDAETSDKPAPINLLEGVQ